MGAKRVAVGLCAFFTIHAYLCFCSGQSQNESSTNRKQESSGRVVVASIPVETPSSLPSWFGPIEVLSDTHGLDFRPYFQDVVGKVRRNWYAVIPQSKKYENGKVAIQFAVNRDGSVSGMKLVDSSGDEALDRAAWAGIATASPFSSLPTEFKGEYVLLRFRFYYNPDEPARLTNDPAKSAKPQYPKEAITKKLQGTVQVIANIDVDGTVDSVNLMDGNPQLGDAAMRAIKNWQFYPARQDGKAVADILQIRVHFRLDGQKVTTEVIPPESALLESAR